MIQLPVEVVQQAVQASGLTNLYSGCSVPQKFCSTDHWAGNLEGFANHLLQLCAEGWYVNCYQLTEWGPVCVESYGPGSLLRMESIRTEIQQHYTTTSVSRQNEETRA